MRLHGKNFQPWAEFDMKIDGLTILVGPSNKGKSSLYRALKGILRNEIPEEFVRNNQDEPLEIELELDGVNLKATRKRKGSTKYTLTPIPHKFQVNKNTDVLYDSREEAEAAAELLTPVGQVKVYEKLYTSLNGKVPDEVDKLKFGEVKIGDYTLDPIFAGQNRAQFLIDSEHWKPNELNAILGAFSSTEKLDAGKKEANSRISRHKSEASTLASEIRSAEERSAELLVITGEASVVAEAVLGLEKGIRGDEAIGGQLGATILHQSRLEPLQKILDTLTLPDLTAVTTLAVKASSTELAADSFIASRFLRRVETSLDEIVTTWREILVNVKIVNGLDGIFPLLGLAGSSRTVYADQLFKIVSGVETQLTEARTLNSSIAYLAAAADTAQSYTNLVAQQHEQNRLLAEAEVELDSARQAFAAELASLKQNIAEHQAANGVCPKCGKGLNHVCQ